MNIDLYVEHLKKPGPNTADICEHLDTLTEYAKKCDHITEMGFRTGTSFAAFLRAHPKKIITYDLYIPRQFKQQLVDLNVRTDLVFLEQNSLKVEIEPTDLLFIDTLHTHRQLQKELELHGNKARKFIAAHDTVAYGRKGEDGTTLGLLDAIEEFLENNPEWSFHEHRPNNNGLTVLRREHSR